MDDTYAVLANVLQESDSQTWTLGAKPSGIRFYNITQRDTNALAIFLLSFCFCFARTYSYSSKSSFNVKFGSPLSRNNSEHILEQCQDPCMCRIVDNIEGTFLICNSNTMCQLRNFKNQNGLLFHQKYLTDGNHWTLVIILSMRTSVLWSLHDDFRAGYLGFYKTSCQAHQHFFGHQWTKVSPYTAMYHQSCILSLQRKHPSLSSSSKLDTGDLSLWTVTYIILWKLVDCHHGEPSNPLLGNSSNSKRQCHWGGHVVCLPNSPSTRSTSSSFSLGWKNRV